MQYPQFINFLEINYSWKLSCWNNPQGCKQLLLEWSSQKFKPIYWPTLPYTCDMSHDDQLFGQMINIIHSHFSIWGEAKAKTCLMFLIHFDKTWETYTNSNLNSKPANLFYFLWIKKKETRHICAGSLFLFLKWTNLK